MHPRNFWFIMAEKTEGRMYMEITLCKAPFEAEEMLCLLEEIFGIEERLLEAPQLTGKETKEIGRAHV